MLAILATCSLQAQGVHYRFTGTVGGSDPLTTFKSPRSPIPGLEVKIGDQLTGTFQVKSSGRAISDRDPNQRIYLGNVEDFSVILNGHELIPDTAPAGDSLLLNNRSEIIGWLELDPLAPGTSDVLTITTPQGGITVGPEPDLGITLNLTDSSASALNSFSPNFGFPEQIEFERFDVTKGFIRTWVTSDTTSFTGIMFNIDSLERFDPNAAPPVKLSTGHHVSWPADAEGYVLEESESTEGPWSPSKSAPIVIDDQNIVVMDKQGPKMFYRLVKVN